MRKFWTKKEDQLMRKLYADTKTEEIAKMLGRSYCSVAGRASVLGLEKSEQFRESEKSGRILKFSKRGELHRFPKGHTPANKGRKWEEYMSPSAIAKSTATLFKKGALPHNTKYDGYTRISREGYLEMRIEKGKFELVHRLIWQQHHGKIPKGHIVVFKDKNPRNLVIENLECIPRAENMRRNTIYRFPPELVTTIKTLSKLKKSINGKKQNQ